MTAKFSNIVPIAMATVEAPTIGDGERHLVQFQVVNPAFPGLQKVRALLNLLAIATEPAMCAAGVPYFMKFAVALL